MVIKTFGSCIQSWFCQFLPALFLLLRYSMVPLAQVLRCCLHDGHAVDGHAVWGAAQLPGSLWEWCHHVVSVFADLKVAQCTPPRRGWRLDVVVGSEVSDVSILQGCWAMCALLKRLQLEPEIQSQPIRTAWNMMRQWEEWKPQINFTSIFFLEWEEAALSWW